MKRSLLSVLFCCFAVTGTVRLPALGQETAGRDREATPSSLKQGDNQKNKYQTLDELFSLYQPYLKNISAYKPIYFLAGTDLEKSKYQISLKYQVFNPDGSWSKKQPWLKGLHFAYTQTSFWDLASDSKPFEDTSYKPEAFFYHPILTSGS